jgi:hypothetical protein
MIWTTPIRPFAAAKGHLPRKGEGKECPRPVKHDALGYYRRLPRNHGLDQFDDALAELHVLDARECGQERRLVCIGCQ